MLVTLAALGKMTDANQAAGGFGYVSITEAAQD
jgi:hypothetical protein